MHIETQVIDLGDDMGFSLLPEGASRDELRCSDPTIPSDDSNLVIKVWLAFASGPIVLSRVSTLPHWKPIGAQGNCWRILARGLCCCAQQAY